MPRQQSFLPEENIAGQSVWLVDSHSLIFQVFHAIPEMTSPQGEPVSAVYGFTRDMLFLLEQKQPDVLICAFDSPGPTFRHDRYELYKADRGEMPEELRSQIPKIMAVLQAMRIPVLSQTGYEADDILATLARECHEQGARCFVVTGDKDCRQMITDRVAVYNIRKDYVFDAAALDAEWGIRPDQVVDFQSLVGDAVDNVPGVPGIGPKTARDLLAQFGTLEKVLDNVSQAKGKRVQENLVAFRDQALMSRELVRLDTQMPLGVDWQALRVGSFDSPRLGDLFSQFGFRSLADNAKRLAGTAQTSPDWSANYQIVNTPEALANLVQRLQSVELVSIDTETTSVNPRAAELVGISLAVGPGEAFYLPVRAPAGEIALEEATAIDALRPVLENPAIRKIGQNLKYDVIVLRNVGVNLAGLAFDTMVASYLLDAGERNHNLDYLAQRYLNHSNIKIEELIGKGRNQKRMDEVPLAQIGPYAAEDADVPLRLMPLLEERLRQQNLEELNQDIETPLVEILADMEYEGIRVDSERLNELHVEYGRRLHELEVQIEEIATHSFNIGSPKQLAEVLYGELKLPVLKKTKTGPSTDADVLEQLAPLHPLPRLVVQHRQYTKLLGTYIDALPLLVNPKTGRVHTSFNQVVAATGRLSSSDPNLQNIPIRTDEGREIRSAFTARARGWTLLCADYSQVELRVLAHFSQDPTMCRAFADDTDIHTLVAAQVRGISPDEVTSAMRREAKAVNFGIIYGQSPFGLAKTLGIEKDAAAKFISEYFARYPGVEQFIFDTLAACSRQGGVTTLLGRRRTISGVRAPAKKQTTADGPPPPLQLNLPERTAVNTVIQGTAADLIKLAMLAVHRRLKAEGLSTRMILQIHDELVFDVPDSELESVTELVRTEMEGVVPLRVPLKVDVKVGQNWAEC
ncbi:MAG: DNA polymerase I [Pirellulales bacterium]